LTILMEESKVKIKVGKKMKHKLQDIFLRAAQRISKTTEEGKHKHLTDIYSCPQVARSSGYADVYCCSPVARYYIRLSGFNPHKIVNGVLDGGFKAAINRAALTISARNELRILHLCMIAAAVDDLPMMIKE